MSEFTNNFLIFCVTMVIVLVVTFNYRLKYKDEKDSNNEKTKKSLDIRKNDEHKEK